MKSHEESVNYSLSQINLNSSLAAIHSFSKKIRRNLKNPCKDLSSNTAKYRTFTDSERGNIISDLKKFLNKIKIMKLNCADEEFLEILKTMNKQEFNKFLKSSLPTYVKDFDSSTEGLRLWRRRIKDWVKVFNKPEGRGSLLVPHEKLAEFKEFLVDAIKELKYRSTDLLRLKLVDIFERIKKPLKNRNTCSKHWWYDFLMDNPDIKKHWDALPKRGSRAEKKVKEESESIKVKQEYALDDCPSSQNGYEETFNVKIEEPEFVVKVLEEERSSYAH